MAEQFWTHQGYVMDRNRWLCSCGVTVYCFWDPEVYHPICPSLAVSPGTDSDLHGNRAGNDSNRLAGAEREGME